MIFLDIVLYFVLDTNDILFAIFADIAIYGTLILGKKEKWVIVLKNLGIYSWFVFISYFAINIKVGQNEWNEIVYENEVSDLTKIHWEKNSNRQKRNYLR